MGINESSLIMTVSELITILKEFPADMDVFVDERETDFTYGLVNSVSVKKIKFSEDSGGEVLSSDKAVVLAES